MHPHSRVRLLFEAHPRSAKVLCDGMTVERKGEMARAQPKQLSVQLSSGEEDGKEENVNEQALTQQVAGLSNAKAELKACRQRWSALLQREAEANTRLDAVARREEAVAAYERSVRSLEAEALARRDERERTLDAIQQRERALAEREQRSRDAWTQVRHAARAIALQPSNPSALKPNSLYSVAPANNAHTHISSIDRGTPEQLHRAAAQLTQRETELEQWALNLEVYAASLEAASPFSNFAQASQSHEYVRSQQQQQQQQQQSQPQTHRTSAHCQTQQSQAQRYQKRRVTEEEARALREEQERKEAREREMYQLPKTRT